MTFATGLTLAVVVVLVLLVLEVLAPDIILPAGLGVLVAARVIDLQTALERFANPTLLAIGSLFIIAEGLRKSGVLKKAGGLLLGGTVRIRTAFLRLTSTSAVASAFLNDTPIVAMGITLLVTVVPRFLPQRAELHARR